MARYIDADKIAYTEDVVGRDEYAGYKTIAFKKNIDAIPTADVAEVKHGEWEVTEYKEHFNVVCSNCKKDFYVYKRGQYRILISNYCPNCGAKMDGGNDHGKEEQTSEDL